MYSTWRPRLVPDFLTWGSSSRGLSTCGLGVCSVIICIVNVTLVQGGFLVQLQCVSVVFLFLVQIIECVCQPWTLCLCALSMDECVVKLIYWGCVSSVSGWVWLHIRMMGEFNLHMEYGLDGYSDVYNDKWNVLHIFLYRRIFWSKK